MLRNVTQLIRVFKEVNIEMIMNFNFALQIENLYSFFHNNRGENLKFEYYLRIKLQFGKES